MPRRSRKKEVGQYALAAVLALAILWFSWLIFGIARKEEVARRAVAETKTELALLEDRKVSLEANMAELDTPRGHEATLRQTYGVARPGEEVIIVVPPDEEPEKIELPWYKKFLGFFGIW
jgi:cell division protein FtsB